MKITLKDGSVREYGEARSVIEIAADLSEGLARAACAGEIDGEVVDLRTMVDRDCALNILTFADEGGAGGLPPHGFPYYGTGHKTALSRCEAGHRPFHCGRLLLRH